MHRADYERIGKLEELIYGERFEHAHPGPGRLRTWWTHVALFFATLHALWLIAQTIAMTNATQKTIITEQNLAQAANSIASMQGLGTPSPAFPGGAPGVYTPAYESQIAAAGADLVNRLHTAGIL